MSDAGCAAPIDLDVLLAYWLHETDARATDAIDAHLLGCDTCGERFDEVAALAHGVRAAFMHGRVGVVLAPAFVERLAARGLRLREYRVPRDGSVNCTVAPDDDVVLGRFEVPLAGVGRLDAVARSSPSGAEERLLDIPFDAGRDEVILVPRMDQLRALQASQYELQLIAVDESGGERPLGRYRMNHRPWPAGG